MNNNGKARLHHKGYNIELTGSARWKTVTTASIVGQHEPSSEGTKQAKQQMQDEPRRTGANIPLLPHGKAQEDKSAKPIVQIGT